MMTNELLWAENTRRRFIDYYTQYPLDSIGRPIDAYRMASYHIATQLEFSNGGPYTC